MQRRSFLGSLAALVSVPFVGKLPIAAKVQSNIPVGDGFTDDTKAVQGVLTSITVTNWGGYSSPPTFTFTGG